MFNLKANKIGIAILSLGMTLQVSAQGKGERLAPHHTQAGTEV